MSTKHTPENTVLWRDPLQPSPGTVPVPAGSTVIRHGRRVRLERTEHAWVFTIPSSRAALGVPDHSLTVALDGSWALCSCGACVNRGRCTLVDNPTAILRHHGLLPPTDPGGAALDAAQDALDTKTRAWTEPPELAGPTACEDAAHEPRTLDELVAAGGDAWLVSRSATRVTLTCAACYGTRIKFESALSAPSLLAGSEEAAAAWLAGGGVCGCSGAGPTPPAQGAARKPIEDHLAVLYGE